MIPILYAGTEKDFLNNGLGRLSDAIKCTVEEERNGTYELEMTYPITGIHYADIQVNNIIYARSEDGGNNQPFIIYKISKPLNGIVTINAQHISYLLNGFIVMPFTASSLADAMNKINANAVLTTGFTFSTDIAITKPFTLDAPKAIRNLLGGESGSLLDVYGGHDYYFDNFNVSLLADRGNDNGVTIRYGKNLTDLKAVSDMTNVYTGIVPFWADQEGGNTVYVDGYVVYSEHAATYPYKYIKVIDFSADFETAPSKAQLLARAESYLDNNDGWKLKSNIEVSFVSLASTEEYKNIAPLERVKLCDTVTVQYTKLGVSFKTKVIRTVYNVLLDRYDSIELGDTTYTLAQAILQANDTPTLQETTSAIQSAVQNATKLIRGGLGGHVVMMADGNGLPQEILIMDTDDITTAQKVWRWNLGGLGYSDEGYDGDYGTAITMDGQIVASFITTGTLNAALIKAGILAADDDNPDNYWNMQTGEFHLSANSDIGQGITIDADGNLVINGSYIRANTISANALTAAAKDELHEKHDYLGNIFNDISLWHTDGNEVTFSYETIDGVKYFVIDATQATAAVWNNATYTPVKLAGNSVYNLYFEYYIDRPITTTATQRLPSLKYKKTDGQYYNNSRTMPAQEIPANTLFVWNTTLSSSSTDADAEAYLGFYPIVGCKMYFKTITFNSSVDSYTTAGMNFNADGLQLLASKLDANETHDYMPFDLMSNTDRWITQEYGVISGTYDFSLHNALLFGETVAVADFNGANLSGTGNVWKKVETDLIGSLTFDYSFDILPWTSITFDSDFVLLHLRKQWRDSESAQVYNIITIPAGTTLNANTSYNYSGTYTLPSVDPNEYKALLAFQFMHEHQYLLYNIQFSSQTEVYKSASLSFTADGLDSVVRAGSIISQINQSAESVSIEASKINLTGDVSLKGAFTAYDPNDVTNYVDMTEGEITVYSNSDAKFAVTCDSLITNAGAGIYFGDLEDPAALLRYTSITQDMVRTPYLYIRADGSHDSGGTPPSGAYLRCEGDAYFYGDVYFEDGAGLTVDNITTPANAQSASVFWAEVNFKGNVFDSNGGLVFISDKRKKRNIKDLAIKKARSFIMQLKPRKYKFKKGISTSNRYHHGFIAQELKEAMGEDWGVYVHDEKSDFIGLRYDELFADMVAVIQDQEKRIEALERAIHDKSNNKP